MAQGSSQNSSDKDGTRYKAQGTSQGSRKQGSSQDSNDKGGTRYKAQGTSQGSRKQGSSQDSSDKDGTRYKVQGSRLKQQGTSYKAQVNPAIRVHSLKFAIIRVFLISVNSRYENRISAAELSYWQF
jgi:hypothetical protein